MAKYKFLKVICDACVKKPNAHLPGALGFGKAAGGAFFLDEDHNIVSEFGVYFGDLTVPQAEYHMLIKTLDRAAGICRGQIEVWMDSELVIKQMNGIYGIKSENMKPLFDKVKMLERRFENIQYFHHSRECEHAKKADKLAEEEYKKHQPK